jgi:DNA invertase Pin-like site-specific DNA recombinase
MADPKVKKILGLPEWLKEFKLQEAGIGIYCRASTSEQRQLRSLSNQITRLIKTVQGWGCLSYLKEVYVDIYSGTSENRRLEFNRMLDDVKAGKIKVVVTKSIQRFGRNTATVMGAINDIRHAGGYVYFEVENLDTKTHDNDNLITIIEGVAQEESYFKSENIKFGIRESLKSPDSGLYNRCCYGYWHYGGKLVPDPITAGTVKDIFLYYKYGRSLRGIAKKLEELGIKSPSGKRVWRIKTIENILKNEKYTGNVIVKSIGKNPQTGEEEYYKAVHHHEGIISQELFDEVQKLFVERSNMEIGPDGKKRRKSTHYSSKNKIK